MCVCVCVCVCVRARARARVDETRRWERRGKLRVHMHLSDA